MSSGAGADRNLFAALRARFPANLDVHRRAAGGRRSGGTAPAHTWRELDEASARIANLLDSLGLPPGARVAAQTEKSVEALILYLAVLRAGRVFLPLNTAYQASEIAYFLKDAEPAMVVCSGRAFASVSEIARQAGIARVFSLNEDRTGTLLESAASHGSQHEPAAVHADDTAVILYTSGTTGRSKGAMLSHANLLANTETLHAYWGWRSTDVLIHALPIFHVHGLFVAAQGALFSGSKMLWFNRFDARAIVQRLPEASVFMGVPTLYVRMLQESGLTQEACRAHAALHGGLRSAPARYVRSVARAHRPYDCRALRHERDRHAHLQSLPRARRRAPRGHRGLPAARRATAHHGRARQAVPPRRGRRHRGQGPERVQGLLAGSANSAHRPSARTAGFAPGTWAESTSAGT